MRRSPEHQLQVWVVDLLRKAAYPGVLWYAVPNGAYKSHAAAAKFKAEGLRAGVADLALVIDGQPAFLELKSSKGRQSPEQKAFQMASINAGAFYAVANSQEAARDVLFRWGAIKASAMLDYYA